MPIVVALRSVEVNFDRGKRHGATATLANQRVTRGRPYSVRCSVSRLAGALRLLLPLHQKSFGSIKTYIRKMTFITLFRTLIRFVYVFVCPAMHYKSFRSVTTYIN